MFRASKYILVHIYNMKLARRNSGLTGRFPMLVRARCRSTAVACTTSASERNIALYGFCARAREKAIVSASFPNRLACFQWPYGNEQHSRSPCLAPLHTKRHESERDANIAYIISDGINTDASER